MARGDSFGLYTPTPIESDDPAELRRWIREELSRIAAVFDIALARNVEFLNAAPAKPREGMITGADGTNWNPGSGKGVYVYYSSAWHLLG